MIASQTNQPDFSACALLAHDRLQYTTLVMAGGAPRLHCPALQLEKLLHDCKVVQLYNEAISLSDELIADKGYDSEVLPEWLVPCGIQPVLSHP